MSQKMHEFFRSLWDEREDQGGYCYCFESGVAMHGSYYRSNSCCYDHVLEQGKTKYPQYAFVKKNVVIVHPDVHTRRHQDIDKTPKIREYREKLLSLHYENNLED